MNIELKPVGAPGWDTQSATILQEIHAGARKQERPIEVQPLNLRERSGNELRPLTFAQMVGQGRLKALLARVVDQARRSGQALDHMLLVGSAGTGKTTFALVIANELRRPVYMFKAPVGLEVLEALARTAPRGSIAVVDECHLWVKPDRRAGNAVASPEQAYSILEDNRLQLATEVVAFPQMTWIGCTTDSGLLPDPFLARFPLQPHLDAYDEGQMADLAWHNADWLSMRIEAEASWVFARACRGIPRIVNRYIRNARSLGATLIDEATALEVVTVLNSTTTDGMTGDMQEMLRFLLRCQRDDSRGNTVYQSGVGGIATALGKSRDSKAVALQVEPYLIQRGFVAVTHGGRALTQAGIERAREL